MVTQHNNIGIIHIYVYQYLIKNLQYIFKKLKKGGFGLFADLRWDLERKRGVETAMHTMEIFMETI